MTTALRELWEETGMKAEQLKVIDGFDYSITYTVTSASSTRITIDLLWLFTLIRF